MVNIKQLINYDGSIIKENLKMSKIKILAIVGKSGSGKDSILKYLKQYAGNKINYIVSSTTRPPREGEVDGINYHYLEHDDFLKLIEEDKIVEMSVFRDWCYGTTLDALDPNKVNIGGFDPMRLDILSDNFQIDLKTILITASDKERLLRSLNRENDPDVKEIIRRYQADEEDFKYIHIDHEVIEIPNHDGDLIKAGLEILNIVDEWGRTD